MSATAGRVSTLFAAAAAAFVHIGFVGFGFDEYVCGCGGSAMMFCGETNPKGGFLSLSSFLLATSCSSDGGTRTTGRMNSGGELG
jgi:hypothetical protein